MNYAQLATAVGQRLGVDTSLSTTRDGAAVRSFLTLRHDQLYRAFLWKDSVIELLVPINQAYSVTSNYMPTKGRVILPPIFQHVLGVRLGVHSLAVQRPMLYYRANYSQIMTSGYACDFTLLSSCVWEFDVAQNLVIQDANNADILLSATLDELQSDTVSIARTAYLLNTYLQSVGTTDRVDTFTKVATTGSVVLGVGSVAQADTTSLGINWNNGSNNLILLVHTNGSNTFSLGQTVKMSGTLIDGVTPFVVTCTVTQVTGPQQYLFTWIQAPGDTATIPNLYNILAGAIIYTLTNAPIITLGPTDVAAPKSQRIQLIGIPTNVNQTSQNLTILGKRNTPPFSAETDVPGINGLEGILFALAYYDFKQRDEAGGSSDAKDALTEAVGPRFLIDGAPGGFLGKLIEEECVQEAYNCRIIPSTGFGGDGYFDEPYGSKAFPYGFY